MSFLEKLRKTLYKKEAPAGRRPQEPEALSPEAIRRQSPSAAEDWTAFKHRGLTLRQWKIFWRGIAAALVLIILGGIAWYFQATAFSLDKVVFKLEGPQSSFTGKPTPLTIIIDNRNRSALKNVQVVLNFPEGTFAGQQPSPLQRQVFDFPVIKAGQKIEKELELRFLGPLEAVKEVQGRLSFVPSAIESPISKESSFSIQIASVPIELFLEAPNEVVAGETFSLSINYINVSEVTFNNLRLRLEAPSGFQAAAAGTGLGLTGSIWDIPKLEPQQEGKIRVRGTLSGPQGVRRNFTAQLFQSNAKLVQDTRPVRIVSAPLALDVTVNGSRQILGRLGQNLSIKFRFTNNFNVALRDLRLQAEFKGEMFDFSSLKTDGDFNPLTKEIIWGPAEGAQFQNLNPGESGEAKATIRLQNRFPISSFDDKNFTVALKTQIIAENVPALLGLETVQQKHTFEIPLESNLTLKTLGFYNETRVPLRNYGPIPPQVGQATAYTLHWQITNAGNDLKDVEISARLPTWVDWTGNTWANRAQESLVYDSKSRVVSWRIDSLPANTGIILPVVEAAFQVELIPAPNQRGRSVNLIGESQITAQDIFTETTLRSFADPENTGLRADPTVSQAEGIVR